MQQLKDTGAIPNYDMNTAMVCVHVINKCYNFSKNNSSKNTLHAYCKEWTKLSGQVLTSGNTF